MVYCLSDNTPTTTNGSTLTKECQALHRCCAPSMRTTCPAHLVLLHLIILTIKDKLHKLRQQCN